MAKDGLPYFIFHKCQWCRDLWEALSPIPQIVGWIVVVIFTGGIYFNKFEAQATSIERHEQRITVLEQNYDHIDQRLDDIAEYLHVPSHQRRGP